MRCNETLSEITGDKTVCGVELNCAEGKKHFDTDAVFIAVGTQPATSYLQSLPLDFDNGYVVAGENCETAVKGVFAAGDIRKKALRQVVTAVADGAVAATGAINLLKQLKQ